MNDILTWQEVLGVTKDATKVEIKKAYHKVRHYDARVLPLT
jgi:DnaJ-class molecular chaperone